jgi:hypothetical protein
MIVDLEMYGRGLAVKIIQKLKRLVSSSIVTVLRITIILGIPLRQRPSSGCTRYLENF